MDQLPEILSADEVGKWLGISSKQVRRLAAAHRLPGVQVGTLWRFSRVQLEQWFAEQSGKAS